MAIFRSCKRENCQIMSFFVADNTGGCERGGMGECSGGWGSGEWLNG